MIKGLVFNNVGNKSSLLARVLTQEALRGETCIRCVTHGGINPALYKISNVVCVL